MYCKHTFASLTFFYLGILGEHRTSRFVLMLLRNGDLWMHHYTLTTN